MPFTGLDRRLITAIRLAGLALIVVSVLSGADPPGTSGHGLVVSVLLIAAALSWLIWTARPGNDRGLTVELYVMAITGGLLVAATPRSAASAFVFVAVIAAGLRVDLPQSASVAVAGTLAVAVSDLLYDGSTVDLLAYTLGVTASLLGVSNARQRICRLEQAELLLAQTQRSHEEQLRAARLEESTRIAREIHDVLAHTLAGLTIQLEATGALLEQHADRDAVLARVHRASELARKGLHETRRAVGALRGEAVLVPAAIETLVAEFRAAADASVELTIDGDHALLGGRIGEAVLRVAQEALTNVRKHAPDAEVSVTVHAGTDAVVLVVDDWPTARQSGGGVDVAEPQALAASGGGYGLKGMRERAELLGGTLSASRLGRGWRVELRLPAPAGSTGLAEGGDGRLTRPTSGDDSR
jgi:signal transduction histidine kinase